MSTRENTVTTVVMGVGEGRFSPGPLFGVGWNARQGEVDSLLAQLAAQAAVIEAAREVVKVDYGNPFIARYAPLHRLKSVLDSLDGDSR